MTADHARLILERDAELERKQEQFAALLVQHDEELAKLLEALPSLRADVLSQVLPVVTESIQSQLSGAIPQLVETNGAEIKTQLELAQENARADVAARLNAIRSELVTLAAEKCAEIEHNRVLSLGEIETTLRETMAARVNDHALSLERGLLLAIQTEMAAQLAKQEPRVELAAPPSAEILADVFRGPLKPGAQAKRGELWTYLGSTYLCLGDTADLPSRANLRGSGAKWALVAARGAGGGSGGGGDSLPSQLGANGKYLKSDGTSATWATVAVLPDPSGQSGKFLSNDGASTTWVSLAGGGDMLAANNLSDVTSVTAAFANIKQPASTTYAGVIAIGTGATYACAGNDSRLGDARTPTAHDHASNKLAQANTHESPDTDTGASSLHHTLGTGANQAAAGNHTHTGVYEPANANIQSHISNTSNPHSVTKAQVGLTNVTDDAQTKAAIVPNTAPSAGQILVGNAGGTAYAPVSMSSDATMASTGAITIANDAVTNAKLANMAASTFKARKTASTGDPEDCTVSEVRTLIGAIPTITESGTTRTLALTDRFSRIRCTSGSGCTITLDSATGWSDGDWFIIEAAAAFDVAFSAAGSMTINRGTWKLKGSATNGQYATGCLICSSSTVATLSGEITA